jgi:peroxiredoxin
MNTMVRNSCLIAVVAVAMAACNSTGLLHVGAKAPPIQTKTLADVGGDLGKITTYRYPDERMYQMSLADALHSGKPILLEFATPAHCTQCDKQLQTIKALLDKYQSRVVFLHMDQYMNTEAYRAFGVQGDPWTFVIDRHGVVRFSEAGRMLYSEIDSEIAKVLPHTS